MAGVRERNGSYLITAYCGYDLSGKQIKITTTYKPKAKTAAAQKKEAKRYAADFEAKVKKGEYLKGEKITFEECFREWKDDALRYGRS